MNSQNGTSSFTHPHPLLWFSPHFLSTFFLFPFFSSPILLCLCLPMAPNGNTREFSLSLDSDLKKVLSSGPTAGLDQVAPTEGQGLALILSGHSSPTQHPSWFTWAKCQYLQGKINYFLQGDEFSYFKFLLYPGNFLGRRWDN